jgi:hypothetical protein
MVRLALARLRRFRPPLAAVLAACLAVSGAVPLEPAQARAPVAVSHPVPPHQGGHPSHHHRTPTPGHHGQHRDCCLASACCVGLAFGATAALGAGDVAATATRAPYAPPRRAPAHGAHVLPFATAPPLSPLV